MTSYSEEISYLNREAADYENGRTVKLEAENEALRKALEEIFNLASTSKIDAEKLLFRIYVRANEALS